MFDIRKIQEQVIFEAVKNHSDDETARAIVYGEDGAAAAQDNAAWVQSTMQRLESQFENTAAKQIRMDCQCGYGMDKKVELVKELVACSTNMAALASLDKAKAAGLFYQDGALYLKFEFCPCPMLAAVTTLKNKIWCQCTVGYSKVLFERAFGCEVEAELLKSIKAGDDLCLMKIIPLGTIWE